MQDDEGPAAFLAGPILHARGSDAETCRLTAVVMTARGAPPPPLTPDAGPAVDPRRLDHAFPGDVWAYDFELPVAASAGYELAGCRYPVVTDLTGDLRIAFVSCNGQEHGDADRVPEDRDVMWRRLLEDHRHAPFALLIHGGDQLYADEATASHPDLQRWDEADDDGKLTVAMDEAMERGLRAFFFERYLAILRQPAAATLYASVPSLMIWDDHDICDGWGSHPRGVQQSAVGQAIFRVAREAFLAFQIGCDGGALATTCLDRSGRSLTMAAQFPDLAIVLPDLRSERTPTRVLGEAGWATVERAFAESTDGARRLVVSSVPTLGPRLSLIEALLDFLPYGHRYEDDLRDQWQSRAHREEWRGWLELLEAQSTRHGAPVTVVSGEIHLAARASMRLANGCLLHQLVASGITHPPPPAAFAGGLGLLSRLGTSPLPGRPVRIRRLPGSHSRYVADRNFLLLEREGSDWTAAWELEATGRTPRMAI